MGFLGEAINDVKDTWQDIKSGGAGLLEDISSWCNNLLGDVGASVTSAFEGDVVGINANKVPEMIDAIENYITRINAHLDEIKTNTSTENAMKGEYALAVKEYVTAACDVCYKITSQLRFFEDKLVSVQKAYAAKDENLASSISQTATEMNSSWQEYKRQS